MHVPGHSGTQSKSQINPLACFCLLVQGTQVRVSRGVWVQTRFCSRKQGSKVTHGSEVIGGAAEKLQCPLLYWENHTGLNSRFTKICYLYTDRICLI